MIEDVNEDCIERLLKMAVRFANNDVGGFASPDARRFLSNTWNLMPESNPLLRQPGLFTILDYRMVLLKSARFLSSLEPTQIFVSYRG